MSDSIFLNAGRPSIVAEIERENIIEQTMNGRREKARQGGWNGGFAPYGYYLKDNHLLIEENFVPLTFSRVLLPYAIFPQ